MSDLSWEKNADEAIKDYKVGEAIRVKVLEIDAEKERISLGVKQLVADPFSEAVDGIKKGSIVTCEITKILDAGLDVSVGDAKGFIRKADLARDRSEQRPDRFAIGEKIDARVMNIDKKTRAISLSVKAREMAEEKEAMATYGSADSGASLGDILGAALDKAKVSDEAAEKPAAKKKAPAKKASAKEKGEEE